MEDRIQQALDAALADLEELRSIPVVVAAEHGLTEEETALLQQATNLYMGKQLDALLALTDGFSRNVREAYLDMMEKYTQYFFRKAKEAEAKMRHAEELSRSSSRQEEA